MIIEFTGSEGTDHDGLSATVGRSDEYHVVKFYNNDIEVADLGRLVIGVHEAISLALEFITGEPLPAKNPTLYSAENKGGDN